MKVTDRVSSLRASQERARNQSPSLIVTGIAKRTETDQAKTMPISRTASALKDDDRAQEVNKDNDLTKFKSDIKQHEQKGENVISYQNLVVNEENDSLKEKVKQEDQYQTNEIKKQNTELLNSTLKVETASQEELI